MRKTKIRCLPRGASLKRRRDSKRPGKFLDLGSIKQKSGKVVAAWAFEGNCEPLQLKSNTCQIEWPPRSGRRLEIPEVDRGRWFSAEEATKYLREEQRPFLDELEALSSSRANH